MTDAEVIAGETRWLLRTRYDFPDGWDDLTVYYLHELCDINVVFHQAAYRLQLTDRPWDELVALLDAAQAAYDANLVKGEVIFL